MRYHIDSGKIFYTAVNIVVVVVILFIITVEHISYVASGLYSNHLQITECNLTVNFWRNYYIRERLQIFSLVEYTPWLIPLLQVRWLKNIRYTSLKTIKTQCVEEKNVCAT